MKISDLKFGVPVNPVKGSALASSSGSSEQESASLESLFCTVVDRHPDCMALADEESSMTFAELDALSAGVANFIVTQGYGPEVIVGVLCRRGSLYLAAAFGVMRAGAVYLPVERELPAARQEVMLHPASLIITDSHCLREAEQLRYKLPHIASILCVDAPEVGDVLEKNTGLKSTAFWEHVTAEAADTGWNSYFSGGTFTASELEELAASILGKCGLAGREQRRVLDIGSGAGIISNALRQISTQYTAVELSRNELDRIEKQNASATVIKMHQMEAVDICFLEGEEYDLITLNGVIENFPGYNYLRRVLNHAVQLLSATGTLFVGAVCDMDRRGDFRAALKELAQEFDDSIGAGATAGEGTGQRTEERAEHIRAGLLRLDASEELFVPERFFTEWAAECDVPVEMSISRPHVGSPEIAEYRFDVVIRRSVRSVAPSGPVRFGTNFLYALPKVVLPGCRPEQAAYIVYTSGSTGLPKGVVVEHHNLMHIIRALKPLSDTCRYAALVAPLSFDASIQQIAVSLFCGKPLYILSDAERKSPAMFCDCVHRNGIDLCDMTPAFFNVLVEYLAERNLSLPMSRLLLAGEILRSDTIHKFYAIPGNEKVVLFNVYGPTECTVDTSAFRIDFGNYHDYSSYPIGRPLDGCEVTIRDRNNNALPDSVTGEIWVSGGGVSRGYFNVTGPSAFTVLEGERCYRTGDHGYTRSGLLFYVGREDQQVKIRGNRVELGEVENAIAGFPGVKQVAVVADIFRAGEEKTLAAYVVGNVDGDILREYLGQLLPSHCVPTYFVPMVELPLSINRKVDKKALPSPQFRKGGVQGRKPSGHVEECLAEIWKTLLGVDVTDAEASFFTLGGHSILAIRLIAMIEKELNVHISISELFANPTLALLSSFFQGKAKVHDSPVIKLCHCEGGRSLFLFHPVGGSVFCYSDLANLLSHKYTVYAVEAAGFRPERNTLNTELHRVEELAEYYLGEILKVETQDIIFGGWSFGGLLAYETACRYERMGNRTGDVLILDSVADNSKAKLVAAKDDVEMLKSLLQDALGFDEVLLRSLPREEKLAYLVSCGEKTGQLPFGFSSVQMDNLLQTYRSNAIAAARYDNPSRTDKKILLVRALDYSSNALIVADDRYQGWSRFLKEENITLKWTEGTHENMLSPGLAGNVAKHILEYLNHV